MLNSLYEIYGSEGGSSDIDDGARFVLGKIQRNETKFERKFRPPPPAPRSLALTSQTSEVSTLSSGAFYINHSSQSVITDEDLTQKWTLEKKQKKIETKEKSEKRSMTTVS